jgi:hypothetical protein
LKLYQQIRKVWSSELKWLKYYYLGERWDKNQPSHKVDNGGRHSGLERRQFLYSGRIPEHRSGKERKSGIDRRLKPRTSK